MHSIKCFSCPTYFQIPDLKKIDGEPLCGNCRSKNGDCSIAKCVSCNKQHFRSKKFPNKQNSYCYDCRNKKKIQEDKKKNNDIKKLKEENMRLKFVIFDALHLMPSDLKSRAIALIEK